MGRILFIRGGAVGDFILTMPAIRLVRESLPGNEIEILGHPSIACLATAAGLADRVRSIEDARLAHFFVPGGTLDRDWAAYFASFNVVVSFLYDPDGIFGANLTAAGVGTLITCPFRPREGTGVPAAVQYAEPLSRIGLFLDDATLDLDYGATELPALPGEGPLVAVHPGSGSASKNWGYESWSALLAKLDHRHGPVRWLVTSGEAERETIGDFLAALDATGLRQLHLPCLPLPRLGAILRRVEAFLGHDSGLGHLAGSVRAPSLLLFGPTDPAIWAPVSPRTRVLKGKNGRLSDLAIEEVAAAAGELFTAS